MKTLALLIVAALTLTFASACSSSARVGTQHHHVSVGGSAN